jgi:tetratricopeptide (TPR) repeat protein
MHLFDQHWTKASVPVFVLLLGTGAFAADRHKPDVDAESGDGILLQRIQQEPRPPRKLALLEKYVAEYSKTTSITWVYEQLLPIYSAAKDYDKVIATADAMLAVDPADVDAAHDGLTAAQAKNDNEAIRLYAQRSWDAATKSLQTPKPSDPDDVVDWNKQQEFARQVLTFSEYVLSTEAAAETDDTKRTELIHALQSRNPQSKFLATAKKDGGRIDLASLSPERAVALAEKGLLLDPNNEDFLITVADYNMGREKDLPKVLAYSLRILELMPKKSKPDDIAPQAWEAKKTKYIGWANWMAGIIYGKQGRYGLSDRYLRSALTYVQEDPRLLAAAYFYLGYANYAIAGELRDKGHAIEAAKFSKMCASIDGPFQSLAQRTLETLRNEYNVR